VLLAEILEPALPVSGWIALLPSLGAISFPSGHCGIEFKQRIPFFRTRTLRRGAGRRIWRLASSPLLNESIPRSGSRPHRRLRVGEMLFLEKYKLLNGVAKQKAFIIGALSLSLTMAR